jgi:type IV secretion system protein VirD4
MSGLCIGEINGQEVRLRNAIHIAVIAPTGAGKGASFVKPNLFECPESKVVVDFGGGLAKDTADYRRRHFGHDCRRLDPWRLVTGTPDRFNPFDFILPDAPGAFDECRALAETQVVRTGKEVDGHWVDGAEFIIGAEFAAVVKYGDEDDRSLQTVRKILSSPENFELAKRKLQSSQDWGGALARLGGQLGHFRDRELASMLTTANRFLGYLDSPAIIESTSSSTFNPMELKSGRSTIYLILPLNQARVASPLLRLWISSMLSACYRGGISE